ncbi:MAG: rRNA maturation RNase YbeY [Pseudomonadota bacterium]
MLPHIDIAYQDVPTDQRKQLRSLIERAVSMACTSASIELHDRPELSILLANDKVLKELNNHWRHKDKPTNVLSFPAKEISTGDIAGPLLGDIAISVETAKNEAELENKHFEDHFIHLVVHGFLHLFGYDHNSDDEAKIMENLETGILAELGISDPYSLEIPQ